MRALFTIDNFEKGLMLAGYISPNNIEEVLERDSLFEYEKKLAKERSNLHFKRLVLAAEIVNQLHEENTFGRVKLQKLLYLSEYVCKLDTEKKYEKFAAGPFDYKFMHSINDGFKKLKWFNISYEDNYNIKKICYTKATKVKDYKKYYVKYFQAHDNSIQHLILLFGNQKTLYVELTATIFACWLELLSTEKEITHDNLFLIFYSWAEEKKRFTEKQVIDTLEWMKEKGITPEMV